MPNLAAFHPIIVHFAIVLLVIGVIFRWISVLARGRAAFTGPAAATLLIAGAIAATAAAHSGTDAHGPVERIPGARGIVGEHEEWGERTRNIFLIVGAIEIAALILTQRGQLNKARGALWGSAIVGLIGFFPLYEAAEHG